MAKINIPHGAQAKILIVEDDQDFLSILETKFTSEGFFVITAQDGENGVIAAEKEKPDLVMSDVLMPKMDGLEMAKKIREFNKNVDIVFLSNLKDVDYTRKIEAGGYSSLMKSDLRISEIVDKIKAKLGVK